MTDGSDNTKPGSLACNPVNEECCYDCGSEESIDLCVLGGQWHYFCDVCAKFLGLTKTKKEKPS